MNFWEVWNSADIAFTVIITVTLLVILYAISLMNRSIKLLQYQVSVIENDLKLMEEEFRILTSKEKPSLEEIKGVDL